MADLATGNPDALDGAPAPVAGHRSVNGTTLYTEVRGSGPTVLLIGAADEDAEFYRGVAERLADGFQAVTYDRRGTRRSGREDWPGGGSGQHADDAAALLAEFTPTNVTVMGFSAGAIVALRLAMLHPASTRTVLCYEPGLFGLVPGGGRLQRHAEAAVAEHLEAHPDDWSGASAALGRATVESSEAASRGLFTPPPGREWFAHRADSNAESLLRGDLALTHEVFDLHEVASCPVRIRFAYGTASLPVFRDIAFRLSGARGTIPDALDGMGHSPFLYPDATASYIRRHIAVQ